MYEKEEKNGELEFKVCLFTDDSVAVVDFKKQLAVRDVLIAVFEKFYANLIMYLMWMIRS